MVRKSSVPREAVSQVCPGKKQLCGKERDAGRKGIKSTVCSSNKICFVFVVRYSSGAKDALRAWPVPLTHRPLGVQGGTSSLSRRVLVGGGIALNSNLSSS